MLAEMSLSTGKSLPRDAGCKFITCNGLPGAHYFLSTMTAAMPLSGMESALQLGLGLCVPEARKSGRVACGGEDVPAILSSTELIPDLHLLTISHVQVSDPVNLAAPGLRCWLAVAVLLILLLFIALSTAHAWAAAHQDHAVRYERSPFRMQLFVFRGNVHLFCTRSKPTDCLNGLRVLAMAWIILGHSFLMPEGVSGYLNPQDITSSPLNKATAESNPLLMIIIQAEQSGSLSLNAHPRGKVSGFLLSHLMLKELQHRGTNPVLVILLRYFRLTPSLALVMHLGSQGFVHKLVYYGILPYVAYGPFAANLQDSIFRRCDGLAPYSPAHQSVGTEALVPIYHKRKTLGWWLLLCLTGLSMGATAWLIARYHLSPYVFDSHYTEYSYYAYSKPYTRAPAYLVGISTAWLIQRLEDKGITRETQQSERRPLLATLAAAAMLCLIIFIPATDFGNAKNSWNDFESILLLDVGRVAWALSWAVITILCYYGYLSWTNAFLAHPGWTPLVRLTYGAYLLHPLAQALGNCLMAYASAVALWCLIERPIMTLTTAGQNQQACCMVFNLSWHLAFPGCARKD
eukprot:Skav231827  [mRNA]  locus=scaffold136:104649:109706:- [translate_table: standard]